jgi:hypothetical protein
MDSTWGGSSANAYDSIANVNTYIDDHVFDKAAWNSCTDVQKAAAIIEATRDIDSLQYIGGRYYENQVLEFPRELSLDFPNNRVGSADTVWSEAHTRMERDVKQACAYQALWIARNSGRNYHAENQAQGIQRYSEAVGPIRESYTYGNAAIKRLCPEAAAKLAQWRESTRIYRG